jgi:DNA-binding CsgD family transcriptional regulator
MARGRPRHPDILTPRQWEVLQLLRESLTDPQIAERLNISLDGAKYHVSEILARLGVSTREEAAVWKPLRTRSPSWLALAWKGAAVTAAATALAGIAVLAYGVFSLSGASESTGETSTTETRAGSPPVTVSYSQRPVRQVRLAYLVPSNTLADGSYFVRTVGSSEPDVPLGNYTPAGALSNNSPYADAPHTSGHRRKLSAQASSISQPGNLARRPPN